LKLTIKLIDRLGSLSGLISGVMLLAALIMVLIEVVMRSVFHGTLYVTDEYCGYVMVGITFLSLAYCLKEKGHIRMTFLQRILKGRGLALLEIAALTVGMVLMAIVTWKTFWFFWEAVEYRSQSMQVSNTYLAIPKAMMPLGCGMFAIQFFGEILKCVESLKNGDYSALIKKDEMDFEGN